jgi:hypothetical protein
MTIAQVKFSGISLSLNKEVKGFLSEVVNTLRPFTIDGEVITINNRGHLKIKGRYPSGARSFFMGTTPSDYRWKRCCRTALKRFIYTEILGSSSA